MSNVRDHIRCVSQVLEALPWPDIDRMLELLHDARLRRAQVFVCGNGGSAATAAHFVNDLNKGANAPGVPRFKAIGLGDNVPLLTAWSNDVSYAEAFAEPMRNLAQPDDVLIAISGSGNSPNVLQAVTLAHALGMTTIGLTGGQGGELAQKTAHSVVVPTPCMEQIEDVHMVLEHALISALRARAHHELLPSMLLADGRGVSPQTRIVCADLPERGAIFLDRDGVINANRPDYVRSWEDVQILPGAVEALAKVARLGWPVVVVTNQAAVNRELVPFEVAESINRRLMVLVAAHGGRLDALVWCPHRADEGCGCRKPQPGLLTYAAQALHLDLTRSYMVGDAGSDIAAGMAVGCKTALVLCGRGQTQRAAVEERWGTQCKIVSDLAAAAEWILTDSGTARSERPFAGSFP